MDYLVITSPTLYYSWQIELLIESFKLQNLEDSLVIGICGKDTQMPFNISQHKRKFIFDPIGDNQVINKLCGICLAKDEKQVGSSFTVMHPDMVLVEPLPELKENVTFNTSEKDNELEFLIPARFPWITIDGAAVFQDVPYIFFKYALDAAQELRVDYKKLGKAAWSQTMYNFAGLLVYSENNLEVTLAHNKITAPIIHYRNGLMPFFNKVHYKTNLNMLLTDDPYKTIMGHAPTQTAQFLKAVVISYLDRKTAASKEVAV